MSTTGAVSTGRPDGRTVAQWWCMIGGLVIVAFGALGFMVNSTFDNATFGFDFDDEALNGDLFLGVEVNGWTNVVNIGAGVLLLLAFPSRAAARAMAVAIGLVYAVVAILGFIDGNDVFDFMVTNTAGNVAYAVFAALSLVAGLLPSPERDAYRRQERLAGDEPRFGRDDLRGRSRQSERM